MSESIFTVDLRDPQVLNGRAHRDKRPTPGLEENGGVLPQNGLRNCGADRKSPRTARAGRGQEPKWEIPNNMSKKVSVINFKGGVGKTTLAFHLAAHLAQKHTVLVIDVDHQSSLSIVMLGGELWEKAASNRKTSNTIFESFCNRKVAMPGDEIINKNPLHARSPAHDFYPNLDLVSAQFELDDTEIELASTTVGSATVSEWQNTVVKNYTGVAEAMDAGWPVWTAYVTQNIKKSIPMLRNACIQIEARLL